MRFLKFLPPLVLCTFFSVFSNADELPTVHFIGASYAGLLDSIHHRFPYTVAVDDFGTGTNKVDVLTQKIGDMLKQAKPEHFVLSTELIQDPKNQDQAIDLTMLVSKENVLQTSYNLNGKMIYKAFAQVRAQALYFDVGQSALVRDIPLSFARIDTFDHPPSHDEVQHSVELALLGDDGHSGLIGKFEASVVASPYPNTGMKFFNVKTVDASLKAQAVLGLAQDDGGKALNDLKNRIADTFAEVMSANQGASFIPYTKDYLVAGRIPLSISNGDAFNIKLPEADYLFHLNLLGAKEVLFGQSVAGKSLIYGTFFNVRLNCWPDVPCPGKQYLDSNFKNGVVVKVPVTQTSDHQDDKFAYDDSMRELFENLSQGISVGATDWISKAASASDINTQLKSTRDLFQSCK